MKEFSKMLIRKVEKLESLLSNNYIGDKNARLIHQSLRSKKSDQRTGKTGKKAQGTGNKLYGKPKNNRNGSRGNTI